MDEILVVTILGLLALAVGTVSWSRVNSSGRHRRGRTAPDGPPAESGGAVEVFDVSSDAGCGDAGAGADGGGGCD
jgi:hypothetical protein